MRPRTVAGRLARIDDWPRRAADARYCASELARLLGEEPKSLQRFFRPHFGKAVQEQLDVFRQMEVERLAKLGEQAKAIACVLHFTKLSHFSRQFHDAHGVSFRVWIKIIRN